MSNQRPDVRRRQRLQYALVILICVAGAVGGVSLAVAHPARQSHHHHGVVFAVVFAAVSAVLLSAFAVFLLRRLHRQPAMQRLLSTDLAQRRATARAIQKREPLTAAQRDTAEAQLENLVGAQRRLTWLLPTSIASLIVATILCSGSLRVFLLAALAFGVVGAVVLFWLQRVQMGRYRRALAGPSS